jgi:ATP-binding cassette subfamily B (MDR/TAP) protein 1
LAFRSILRQDITFFDQDDNSAGSLTATLSSGASDLAGISGATLGAILNFITTIISATILSCIIGWKLGLVCTSTVPILLLGGYSRMTVFAKFQARASKAYRASATLACEAVSSISTIASLTREDEVWSAYHNMLQKQLSQNLNSVLKTSWLFAGSDSFALFCMALGFWYGGRLILSGEYSMFQFFVCFSSVIFSAQSAGALFSFAPDMAKSRYSAQQLKLLCAREPEIDSWSDIGDSVPDAVVGQIDFQNVFFSYPTRRVPVLQGLNLSIAPGEFVALVGASGCGKSTTIALLERLYNASSGTIFIDGQDISKLKIRQHRSHIALVSQEPVLFSGTVRENIALGIADDMIDEENIVEVCKTANIWDFIVGLPVLHHSDEFNR